MNIEKLRDMPIIELEDIILRPIVYDDYKDMYEYGSNENVTKWLSWGPYNDINDAIFSLKNKLLKRNEKGLPSTYAIVHKNDNKMIGTIGYAQVDFQDSWGDIAYALNEKYWGRGIVSKACKEVINVGFNYLGLSKIVAKHLPENIGSKKVILRNGFKYIKDVHDKRTDQLIPYYELEKEEKKYKE